MVSEAPGRRRRGPVRRAVSVVLIGLAVAFAWSILSAVVPVVSDSRRVLTGPGAVLGEVTCTPRSSTRDVVVDAGRVVPRRGVDVTDVVLVHPVNVTVVDAVLVPYLGDKPPVIVAPPMSWRIGDPWPDEWDWGRAVDPHGGHLDPFGERRVVLHVEVVDPTRRAAFSDVEVRYRDEGKSRAERVGGAWATSDAQGDCTTP